jgi:hypothetical protein
MSRAHPLLLILSVAAAIAGCAADAAAPVAPLSAVTPTLQKSQESGVSDDEETEGAYTLAVIGDMPYGAAKLAELPSLIDRINADPDVRLVAHLGDIKAGKNAPCTDDYFATVRALFDRFADPLVYTPGDNEWTDCHVATKNNGLYTPTERLQKVRELFFPVPGRTLGARTMHVFTQADDRANSAYVENAMFRKADVVFATLNITGSNNDGVSWGTPLPANAGDYPSQAQEQASRARANEAWLRRAFATATRTHAAGVVLLFQADMWDTAEPTLSGFDALVTQIGTLAARYGKPVLLLEGDSHAFRVDNPFAASSPLHVLHPATPIANNVTRIVVEGSDAGRTEYLRLSIGAKDKDAPLFAWTRIPLH